ncbi:MULTISPECIES: ATP-dependent protease ATPase subunit HslU [unclassified Saccharibacter]|uniref:ATP-dependent protease ATPase subunit HslU n=1 Tax=unclassified Saccharibacter TaxID=2648722 RepID=UPI001323E1C4|nr:MULTISPECIES: ATP-dependent protease ATPase subunit HslU [unclassified Saccharibacter]MXV34985.1 ATP-dependent protease ATPase subunit HslU [Saccharibacter sp. EH611]MXV57469.1 ATP-dependent protease ATPase subunit HslU [Saccharibacter sp. EH70]MXV64670.1 ATP-dependent protease ATPase subunit HslU [Saccharibacter sp. EH60]
MSVVEFAPRQTVHELDRFIIGQDEAKRAVAVALRNRWRRAQLPEGLREEVVPKNILMIGPTGCGKTEIARRLARLANAPFLKVEATKFTEVGYVGRDVDSIVRDLVDVARTLLREKKIKDVQPQAEKATEERLVEALAGKEATADARLHFRQMLRDGDLEEKEIEIEILADSSSASSGGDFPPMLPGQVVNLGDVMRGAMGREPVEKKMTVAEAREHIMREEADQLLDEEALSREAVAHTEEHGIVFLDEIDKVCATSEQGARTGDISREGVQRDLLPLIEGTTVTTKHGSLKTDHILFIASGAFHIAKPSDLLPELQGRLPIRVELSALTREDLRRILLEPEHSLVKQYTALMATEGVRLEFDEAAIDALAELGADINERVENIGARRLATVLERLLEDISFTASERSGEVVRITAEEVHEKVSPLMQKGDLSRFIL